MAEQNDTTALSVRYTDVFKEQLARVSDAGIGVIAVRTREPFRCAEVLHAFTVPQEMTFKLWSIITGWGEFPNPKDVSDGNIDYTHPRAKDDIIGVGQAILGLRDAATEGLYVMMNCQFAFEDPMVQQAIKNHVRHALDNRKRLVLLLPEAAQIPEIIEDDVHIIDFKTPSQSELREVWDHMLENIEADLRPTNFEDDDISHILRNAMGMTAGEFENALSIAFVTLHDQLESRDEEILSHDFVKIILESKTDIIKRTDILELLPEVSMDSIGGLDLLKTWLAKRAKAMQPAARAAGIDPPKGALLVGPPGGGKSQIAKAMAAQLGVSGIKFNVDRVFARLVGQSEERTRKALALIDAMAPCLVLIDEVDKGLGGIMGGGGDSGVSMRVLGAILTWMQDRTKIPTNAPVFVIFTANNVHGLPPELLRKGRLDEIFAVTFPGEVERAEIVKIHCELRGQKLPPADYKMIAKATRDFVGSELEGLVAEARLDAFNAGEKLTGERIRLLAGTVTPLSVAFRDKVTAMNQWARNNAKAASSTMTFDDEPQPEGSAPKIPSRAVPRRRPSGPIKVGRDTARN